MSTKKINVAIVGCGKAGLEHARVLRTYFKGVCNVVRLIDIDDENTKLVAFVLGDLYRSNSEQIEDGVVVDCRPFHIRLNSPIRDIAAGIFDSYEVVEEKPASFLLDEQNQELAQEPDSIRLLNIQRVRTPLWKKFRSSITSPRSVICIERNSVFPSSDVKLLSDFLPHSCSFVFDLIDDELTQVVWSFSHESVRLEFASGFFAIVIFSYSDRPSCTVTVEEADGTKIFQWPHAFTLVARNNALPFFGVVASLKGIFNAPFRSIGSLVQYYKGPSLYDDFRYTWADYFQGVLHCEDRQHVNQRLLSSHLQQDIKEVRPKTEQGLLFKDRVFDLAIIGGSGFLGRSMFPTLEKLNVLIVSRTLPLEVPDNVKWASFDQYLDNTDSLSVKRIILMSSAMGGDFNAHNAHNQKLELILKSTINISSTNTLFISSRAIYTNPGNENSPQHNLQSARLRGPYSYGKLMDQMLFETIFENKTQNIIWPGVIAEPDDLTYGLSISIFGFLFVVGSPNAKIPFSDKTQLVEMLSQWAHGDGNVRNILTPIKLENYFSEKFKDKRVVFLPKFITKILTVLLHNKYKKLRPLEDLWWRIRHFYEV